MSIFAKDVDGYYALHEFGDNEVVYYIDNDKNAYILECKFHEFLKLIYEGHDFKLKQQRKPYYGIDFYESKETAAKDYQFLEI